MYEMRIKCSGSIGWFYSCNSFHIFLNTIFKFRQQFCDEKILALFHCHLFEYPTIKQAYVFSVTKSPSVLYLRLFINLFFNGNLNKVMSSMKGHVDQWCKENCDANNVEELKGVMRGKRCGVQCY